MPPKSAQAVAAQALDAAQAGKGSQAGGGAEKKIADNRMPSKRENPLVAERAGVHRPPSRVMLATPGAPPVPRPLLRSTLLQLQQPGSSNAAYGLTSDGASRLRNDASSTLMTPPSRGAASSSSAAVATAVTNMPDAPELDTQYLALRRLQGRYIGGPHGDLLKADGIASGVTEPFFFSAVRPGSSANKRASGWFNKSVQPMLGAEPLDAAAAQQQRIKRALSAVAAGNANNNNNSARSNNNAMETSARPSSAGSKKKKSKNPQCLRDWVAQSFGTLALGCTPSITKEFHAQAFPLVRADGTVEIALVAQRVLAAMAPTMPDAAEIAAAWMEALAVQDRAAAEDAAVANAVAAAAAASAADGESDAGSASVSVAAAAAAAPRAKRLTPEEEEAAALAELERQQVPAPVGAPPGFIAYAILLYNVRRLLTDDAGIEAAYDLCDVCADGVVTKEAVKRCVALLMGKKDPVAERNERLAELQAHVGANAAGVAARQQQLQKLHQLQAEGEANNSFNRPLPVMAADVGSGSISHGAASPTSPQQHSTAFLQRNSSRSNLMAATTAYAGDGATTSVPSGSQSVAGGVAPTTVISGSSAWFNDGSGAAGAAAKRVSGALSVASGSTSLHAQRAGMPAAAGRTLRQLRDDLQLEQQRYEQSRQQPAQTTAEFVDTILRSTTMGEAPAREPSPPPGRFWVTARPRQPAPLVPSPHFHFAVSTALMRAFRHIAGFEEYWALFKGKRTKKKGAALPSMRQEHISRAEFRDLFLCDPHIAAPFLPFLVRRAVRTLPESALGPQLPSGSTATAGGGAAALSATRYGGGGGGVSDREESMSAARSPARSVAGGIARAASMTSFA